jgi:hypothetical protein
MHAQLTKIQAPDELIAPLGVGWTFGSFAMAAMGTIVTVTAWRQLRGQPTWKLPALVVAIVYIAFGIYGCVARGTNLHLGAFSVLGILAAGMAVGPWGANGPGVVTRCPSDSASRDARADQHGV